MRDLGRELGLHGSSLYSHVTSKEDLLVELVRLDELAKSRKDLLSGLFGATPEPRSYLKAGHLIA